jgi:ParB-like chromosome segregation protein Spo0J
VTNPSPIVLAGESDHDRIRQVPLARCRPSPENDTLYRPADPADPAVVGLADSIKLHGLQEPIVLTADGYILSGHRRRAAAALAGLAAVPCRVVAVRRADDPDEFLRLLREFNRQRVKTRGEQLREAVLDADPEEAYQALVSHRARRTAVELPPVDVSGARGRAAISPAKEPFLAAVLKVLAAQKAFWPLSDRRIHYALLNDPPLRHARKRHSRYANTLQSYKSLVDLLTRARLEGRIGWAAINDETRPIVTYNTWADVGAYLREEVDEFGKGYWRDLMQSQPDHVEVIAEKNTVAPILKPVCAEYCIPMVTGRGYCSLPPRYELAQRFRRSGKDKLVLLLVTDFDPDGQEIAASFARSMRLDFGIEEVRAAKVALTAGQVKSYALPPVMKAKERGSRAKKFTAEHGDDVFELEALPPEELQRVLRAAIDRTIDVDAFNAEVTAEKADARYLEGVRRTVHATLPSAIGNGDDGAEGGEEGGD